MGPGGGALTLWGSPCRASNLDEFQLIISSGEHTLSLAFQPFLVCCHYGMLWAWDSQSNAVCCKPTNNIIIIIIIILCVFQVKQAAAAGP